MERSAIRRTESHLEGALGQTLFRRSWAPGDPERALVLVHGYAEHSGRYEHVGAWFAQRGCAVHAYDQQGHGRSEGRRCHVRRFGDYLDDLELVHRSVAEAHPGLPLFVVGHSMGGLVAAAYARERQPHVAGIVLSAPALAVADDLSPARLLLARVLRRVIPTLDVGSDLDPTGLSRDPAVVEAYIADPYVYRKMTASLGAEMLDAVARTAAGAVDVKAPMLLLHGDEDPMCPVAGSRTFYEGLGVEGKALRVYPGLRHEIFNEPERELVFEDLLRWLRERAG